MDDAAGRGNVVDHYVDDFITVDEPGSDECARNARVGAPVEERKSEGRLGGDGDQAPGRQAVQSPGSASTMEREEGLHQN